MTKTAKIVLFLALFNLLVLPAWSDLADPTPDELEEGFDKQSSGEIVKARWKIIWEFWNEKDVNSLTEEEKNEILARYQYLDPKHEVPQDLLDTTVLYYDLNKLKFPNQDYISIINFKARSDYPRFFVIDMKSGVVEKFRTAHGLGSDFDNDGYAEKFSNVVDSGTSSLGFIRTAEVYSGRFKRSIRIDGLSSTNSKIRERAIVVHGWDYVKEAPIIQGLSRGCPALDWKVKDRIIDKIKEGSLMYMGLSSK